MNIIVPCGNYNILIFVEIVAKRYFYLLMGFNLFIAWDNVDLVLVATLHLLSPLPSSSMVIVVERSPLTSIAYEKYKSRRKVNFNQGNIKFNNELICHISKVSNLPSSWTDSGDSLRPDCTSSITSRLTWSGTFPIKSAIMASRFLNNVEARPSSTGLTHARNENAHAYNRLTNDNHVNTHRNLEKIELVGCRSLLLYWLYKIIV